MVTKLGTIMVPCKARPHGQSNVYPAAAGSPMGLTPAFVQIVSKVCGTCPQRFNAHLLQT